ncbi:MAG: MBL fold metallo-hydrolase [Gammaproteobacteria bacterium]|jgi:ribonuclease BN (tRNA processing enzyme)|nr:MBL fold metallo-hydrolase [Gammaproteobacteria bacterium]
MMNSFKPALHCSLVFLCSIFSASVWSACQDSGVQLQILGSGGPGPSNGRASSGYLLWIDGESRIMVDAGSGTKDQFHRANANLDTIDLIALSHLHPDHSAELPAILWTAGGSFYLSGPTPAGVFPSIENFLDSMFGPGGAFRILADRIDLEVFTVDTAAANPVDVWREGNILVRGTGVPHGDVPTIGYRIDFPDVSIAFTSDQNGSNPSFIDFIQGVDYLVIHLASSEDATGFIAELHAKPSVWGQMATAADVGHVIVSHISTSSPQALEESLTILRSNYSGALTVGEDLMCFELN